MNICKSDKFFPGFRAIGVDSGPSISEHVHPELGECARQVF